MRKKVNIGVLLFSISIGNLTFAQELSSEEKKIEKGYLLEEYQGIKEELSEKISYVENQSKEYQEIYKDILLEYEELKKELLKDIEKVKGELKEWKSIGE